MGQQNIRAPTSVEAPLHGTKHRRAAAASPSSRPLSMFCQNASTSLLADADGRVPSARRLPPPRQCRLRDDSDMSPPALVRRRGSSTAGRLDRSLLPAAGSEPPDDDTARRFRILLASLTAAAAAASSAAAPSSESHLGIASCQDSSCCLLLLVVLLTNINQEEAESNASAVSAQCHRSTDAVKKG